MDSEVPSSFVTISYDTADQAQQSLAKYTLLLDTAIKTQNKLGEVYWLLHCGIWQFRLENFDACREFYEQAKQKAQSIDKKYANALADAQIWVLNLYIGDVQQPVQKLKDACDILSIYNDVENLPMYVLKLAWIYRRKRQMELSLQTLEKGLVLAKRWSNERWYLYGQLDKSQLFWELGHFSEAAVILEHMIEKSQGWFHLATGMAYQSLAIIYVYYREFRKSLPLFHRAFQYFEKIQSSYNMGAALSGIGDCFREFLEFSRAKQYYQKAKQVYEQLFGHDHEATRRENVCIEQMNDMLELQFQVHN